MILVLVASADNPSKLVRDVLRQVQAAGEEYLISTVPALFLRFENTRRAQILHNQRGIIDPCVIFHWVGGRYAYSALDALEIAGYRLINPRRAWHIGRNKCLQLAVFEREGVPHPWTLFGEDVSFATIADQVQWDGQEYVLKPHGAGRGMDVNKARTRRTAAAIFSRTPRYRQGVLVQEYLDHAPKVRHHFRVNVVGGKAVTGCELRATAGNWVTNQARGGRSMAPLYSIKDIPEDAVHLALRAAEAVGADYSGVDVIEGSDGGFYVLEANEFPGFGERTALHLGRHIVDVARRQRQGTQSHLAPRCVSDVS